MRLKFYTILSFILLSLNISAQELAFKANIDQMTPMKYPPRCGLSDFSLEVRNDSAFVYLPYMGEVYNPTFSNDGLNFAEPCKNIIVKGRKKNDGKDISFTVKHDIVTYRFQVTLYNNNSISIYMQPDNAQSCSYNGNWEEMAEAKPTVVIVFYDPEIGSVPLEKVIKQEKCEIIYKYSNFNGYALNIPNTAVRHKLESTKGVLSVQDDRVMKLQDKFKD